MKSCHMRSSFNVVASTAAFFISVALLPSSVKAQVRSAGGSAIRVWEDNRIRAREMRESERALENLGKERRVTPAKVQPILPQIREDFERVQIINNEIIRLISGGNVLNYKLISDRAAEVRKRASRLKTSLALSRLHSEGKDELHSEGKDEKNLVLSDEEELKASISMLGDLMNGAPDDGQMKTSLSTLAVLIKSFVTNPLFANSRVDDNRVLTRVSRDGNRDLENIIELSGSIKRSAALLAKTHNTSQ